MENILYVLAVIVILTIVYKVLKGITKYILFFAIVAIAIAIFYNHFGGA